jgi:aminomethyltransferase
MTDADGWSMPLEYAGVLAEYRACRRSAVVWDASNLGSVRVCGPGAAGVVQRTFTNDLHRAGVGGSQYTFLVAETDGGVVDEAVVWWVRADLVLVMPNRPGPVVAALRRAAGDRARVEDGTAGRALLAVQGPRAADLVGGLVPAAAAMGPARVLPAEVDGRPVVVATTRFGRRPGFELHVEAGAAPAVHRALVAAGAVPAGLAMRETHRIEAGVPRPGFELGPDVSPFELGFAHTVRFDTEFTGRAALRARRSRGVDRVLRTVVMAGRRVPARGSTLYLGETGIGRITSGNYSPRLHRGLAFAFVRPDVPPGTAVTVSGGDAVVTTVPIDLEAAW